MRLHMIAACVLSFGVHSGILLLLPAPSLQYAPPPEPPSDVELVAVDVPLPPVLQPPPPEPPPEESPSLPTTPTYDASQIAQPDLQRIDGAIEKMSAGISMQLSMPGLQLPSQHQAEEAPEPSISPPPDTTGVVAAMLEPSPFVPGKQAGLAKQVGLGEVRLGTKQSPSRLGLPTVDPQLVAPPLPTPPPVFSSLPPEPAFGIQGPVAEREPLFRPELPEVQVQTESEIALKFWVRPDGVVSRVITERKGDTALEAAAIQYIEGWRFTPLPPHESQEEQWGTITMRFLLPQR